MNDSLDGPRIREIPPGSTALRELTHAIDSALALPKPATGRDELTYLRIARDRLVRAAAESWPTARRTTGTS